MKKIAVLVSGKGSNLQAIIDAVENKTLAHISIEQVIADRYCFALERALEHDIPAYMIEDSTQISEEIHEMLQNDIDYIVLAGFLSILSEEFCQNWNGKIINIHPSLLPKFGGIGMYGKHVHQAVIDAKESESGATVHYVIPEIDKGEIILQQSISVAENDTAESLAEKIHTIEHILLVEALQKLSH